MEAEKRKNKENDIVPGPTPKKARDLDPGETAVNDDEVEEFYAILRRIHAAVTYFEKGTGDGRRSPVKGSKWRQGLEKEILEEVKGAGGEKLKRIEDVEENVGFDLNVNPGFDEDAVRMDFI